jgi:hypothetical protein
MPATAMAHMNQKRQNIHSIKNEVTSDLEDETFTPASLGTKTHFIYAVVIDQGQRYIDLTGSFPARSSKVNWHVMVCYSYDFNYVKSVPMKSRSSYEWLKAYGVIHQELTSKGFKPKLQTLDNEASAALKSYFAENDVEFQLVPPHCHRRNAAERAIGTFKEHFATGLASVDPYFLLHLWDRLLPQAEMMLNLLRTPRKHPQLPGLVDYKNKAFAPSGCKIIAHEKLSQRWTWAPHGQHGYSLGPAMHHYRCQNLYISSTASERIVDTLEFSTHNLPMPQISSMDRLLMDAHDMTDALKHHHRDFHFATIGDDTIIALPQLATIFKNKFQNPEAPEISQAPVKSAENKRSAAQLQQVLTSPVKHNYQTISQNQVSPTSPANIIELWKVD